MRIWLVAVLVAVPTVAAEFGAEENGYPVGEGGFAHDPAQRLAPAALAAVQARALADRDYAEAVGLVHDPPLGPLNQVGPATLYPYYPIASAEIQRLAMLHPEVVRLHSAGKSELGLDLWMLEIADFSRSSEADFVPLEQREVIWIDGGTHSNEYSGVYFVLAVAQFLVESYGDNAIATQVVENRHTWIMPMVNPDGSHVMGRMNANTVNINRNYPVIWGGEGTDLLLNNPGPFPASEAETQINIQWFNLTRPDYYASIHCCGNLWLFPYGEDGYDPPDYDMLMRTCVEALPEVGDACGPIWSTIYPASGSSVDTAYEYTGASAWGFEMSGRSNLVGPWGEPVTFAEVFDQERESWLGIQHAFMHVHRYGAYLVIDDVQADATGLSLRIRNDGMGNLTGGSLVYGGPAAGGMAESSDDAIVTLDMGRQFGRVALPALATNESITLHVNGAAEPGEYWLQLDYPKRIWETTNWRDTRIPVLAVANATVELLADGTWKVPTNPQADEAVMSTSFEAPAAPVALLAALLVGFALRRRHETR